MVIVWTRTRERACDIASVTDTASDWEKVADIKERTHAETQKGKGTPKLVIPQPSSLNYFVIQWWFVFPVHLCSPTVLFYSCSDCLYKLFLTAISHQEVTISNAQTYSKALPLTTVVWELTESEENQMLFAIRPPCPEKHKFISLFILGLITMGWEKSPHALERWVHEQPGNLCRLVKCERHTTTAQRSYITSRAHSHYTIKFYRL